MSANYATVYQGLKLFRDAMLSFIIERLQAAYGNDWWEQGVRRCFRPEDIDRLEDQFYRRYGRAVPFVFRPGTNLYEILDVNHFANVLRRKRNWEKVFAQTFNNDRTVLTWLEEIVHLRNAVAHPETGDLRYSDAWRGLDTAERILCVFNEKAADEVAAVKKSLRAPREALVSDEQWRDYCQSLVDEHAKWTDAPDVSLEELKIIPTKLVPVKKGQDAITAELDGRAKAVDLMDFVEKCKEPLVILGDPGTGKTAALERLTIEYAQRFLEDSSRYIPVLVKLRRYDKDRRPIPDLIATSLQARGCRLPNGQFEAMLEDSPLFLLFDGLDEAKDKEVIQDLEIFSESHRQAKLVVTSRRRYYDESGMQFRGAQEAIVAKFSEEEIEEFLVEYYQRHSDDPARGREIFQSLDEATLELVQSPLMLHMVIKVVEEKGEEILANRAQLCQEFVQSAEKRERWKKTLPDGKSVEKCVLRLALAMQEEGAQIASKAEVYQIVEEYLEKERQYQDEVAREVLRHPLLTGKAADEIRFWHPLFQDYFAARGFEDVVLVEGSVESVLNYIGNPKWRETIVFLAALMDNASTLIERLLDFNKLSLAAECLRDARSVNEGVEESVIEQTLEELTRPGEFDLDPFLAMLVLAPILGKQRTQEELAQRLIPALEDAEESVRYKACFGLWVSPLWDISQFESAIGPLADVLRYDSSERVRSLAVRAMGQIDGEAALDRFRHGLQDSSEEVRLATVEALAKIDSLESIRLLRYALSDADEKVRLQAIEALAEKQPESEAVMDAQADALFSALSHRDLAVATEAALKVGGWGYAEAIPALARTLREHHNDEVRLWAVNALGVIDCPGSNDALTIASLNSDWEVALEAGMILKERGDPRAVAALVRGVSTAWERGVVYSNILSEAQKFLDAVVDELNEKAAASLIQLLPLLDSWRGQDMAFKLLAKAKICSTSLLVEVLFGDANVDKCLEFIQWGLAQVSQQWATEVALEWLLYQLANDPMMAGATPTGKSVIEQIFEEVAGCFDSYLETLVKMAISAPGDYLEGVTGEAQDRLYDFDYEEVNDLWAEALSDPDETRRNWAAIILGERGDARAANALIPLLAQEHWAKKAEDALWEIGAESTGPLVVALSSSDVEIREKAADILDYIGEVGTEEVDLLIATLSSPYPDAREKATLMLRKTSDAKAVEALVSLLVDEEDNIRLAASVSLNTLKDPRAIPVLVSFLDDPRFDFRFNAFWELAKIGYFQEHIEALEALTQDPDERIRMFATPLLEDIEKQGGCKA